MRRFSDKVMILVIIALTVAVVWQATLLRRQTTLDARTAVIERTETEEGAQVASPTVVPLYEYVDKADPAYEAQLQQFLWAFEDDVHAGDMSFPRAHEFIDETD